MQAVALGGVGTRARLSFYSPALRQAAHRHERAHISIIIAGTVREVSNGRDDVGFPSTLTLRPYEITHQVEFGPHGALILAVDLENGMAHGSGSGWVHRGLSRVERTLMHWLLTEGTDGHAHVGDYIQDLVAGIETDGLRGSPPSWLVRAREQLMNEPASTRIECLARAAGVHRAHFARAFQHWFRTSPSVFRRRAMLSCAIAEIASGEGLALAAHSAGFADQSHLCRAMRSTIGVTPHRLMRQRLTQHSFNT
jgi:AraC family transcriptional regulator